MKKGYLASAVVLTLAVVMLSAYVVSNEGGDTTIEGRWVIDMEQAPLDFVGRPIGFPLNMDLLKDGTGVYNRQDRGIAGGITWKTENGCLYVFTRGTLVDDNTFVLDYKISGSTLTLTRGDGLNATYTKRR